MAPIYIKSRVAKNKEPTTTSKGRA